MKTVELSAALGQAQVVENLKNFVGVDAQGAAALMTPERLAAVAGESQTAAYSLLRLQSSSTMASNSRSARTDFAPAMATRECSRNSLTIRRRSAVHPTP